MDCQAGVGLVGSELGGGPALAAQYQAALENSVAHHFSNNHVINCMCHSTENLYRSDSDHLLFRSTAMCKAREADPEISIDNVALAGGMFVHRLLATTN